METSLLDEEMQSLLREYTAVVCEVLYELIEVANRVCINVTPFIIMCFCTQTQTVSTPPQQIDYLDSLFSLFR